MNETKSENDRFMRIIYSQVQFYRGKGSVLRTSLHEDVTIEYVRNVWDKVTDMSQTKHFHRMVEASGALMGVLEKLEKNQSEEFSDTFTFGPRDVALYALGGKEIACYL